MAQTRGGIADWSRSVRLKDGGQADVSKVVGVGTPVFPAGPLKLTVKREFGPKCASMGLPPTVLEDTMPRIRGVRLGPGDFLIDPGDVPDFAGVVIVGAVKTFLGLLPC